MHVNNMVEELKRSIEALWLDYQFLTREIAKFVDIQDFDFVFNLIEQREQLQSIIGEQGDGDEFRQSERGKILLQTIYSENQAAMQRLQFMLNHSKRQHTISQAYEGNVSAFIVGDRMNRKT